MNYKYKLIIKQMSVIYNKIYTKLKSIKKRQTPLLKKGKIYSLQQSNVLSIISPIF